MTIRRKRSKVDRTVRQIKVEDGGEEVLCACYHRNRSEMGYGERGKERLGRG